MAEEPEDAQQPLSRRAAFLAAGGVMGGAGLLGALVAAGARPAEAGSSNHGLVGTWINSRTKNGGVSIATFGEDGSWHSVHPNPRRSPALGTWTKGKGGTFIVTRWSLRFDEQGRVTGTLKTRAEVTVDRDGNGLTSRRVSELFDLAGNLLGTSPSVDSRALRLIPEAPPPR
jgi:hypothetical protein